MSRRSATVCLALFSWAFIMYLEYGIWKGAR